MAKDLIFKTLSRIVKLKPGELKISLLLFSYLFLVTAPYSIIKSLRNASFLDELGAKQLPFAYLLTALVIGFVVAFHSKIQANISRSLLITFSLVFFFLSSILFRIFSDYGWTGLPVVFWVWANIFIIVLNTQFWITVNDILNPREFKRLSGFFISGGILGGIVGGGLAGLLAQTSVDYNLLFFAAGLLLLCGLCVYSISRWQKRQQPAEIRVEKNDAENFEGPSKPGFRDSFNTVRKHRYLSFIAIIVILTLVVSTLIDFQFNTVVEENKGESLTRFFGYFNSGLMVFAFFLSLLMTSNLFKRYGVRLTLLLYPLVLLLCSVGIGVAASLVLAILIKGSDKSLSYSINRSARELLYIPVSHELKYKAIVFIEMFVDRFSKGIGGLILIPIIVLKFSGYEPYIRIVSAVACALILGWIVLTLKASKEYIRSVNQKISRRWERGDHVVSKELDVDFAKLIFDTLESKDRSFDLYAMHLYDLIKQGKLTSELKGLIDYDSEEMKNPSLGTFFEMDPTPMIQESDAPIQRDVLKKNIEEIMSLDVYQQVIMDYLDKLLPDQGGEVEVAKMEVAKSIGFLDPDSPLVERLEDLLQDRSPDVVKYAVESAGKLGKREFVPVLAQKLCDPLIREDAASALEKYGLKIVGTLADYLGDQEEDIELRRSVASVLAQIGSQEATDFIQWEIQEGNEDINTELIDALDRIRSRNPEIEFSKKIIAKRTRQEIKNYYSLFIEFSSEDSDAKSQERCETLGRNMALTMMNIFKLLGLIYPHEDIVKAYQNIQAGTKDSVAYAVELLDNTLQKEIREAILPIIDDLSEEERLKACLMLRKNLPDF
jgi:AAA family ATP:ADP antiporter